MYETSARISVVKNFVSSGTSLVRAFPLSQVKSANAKGSAFGGLAAVSCLVERFTGKFAAATLTTVVALPWAADVAEAAFVLAALKTAGAGEAATSDETGCAETVCVAELSACANVFGLLLDSNSATRFSSCSTRSSSQRSRSVRGNGASGLLTAGLAVSAFFSVPPSSAASNAPGVMPIPSKAAQSTHKILFPSNSARISCSSKALDKRPATKDANSDDSAKTSSLP